MTSAAVNASDELMESLLAGRSTDLPAAGADELSVLVSAARGPVTADELNGRTDAVARLVAGGSPQVVPIGRGRTVRRLAAAKVAAVVALAASAGVAAAAATGVIDLDRGMGEVQTTSSPSETSAATSTTLDTTSTSDTGNAVTTSSTSASVPTTTTVPGGSSAPSAEAVGPSATGPARLGLCTAFGARTELPDDSVAARNLAVAAMTAGQTVAEFCADTTTTTGPRGSKAPASHPGGTSVPPSAGQRDGASRGGTPDSHADDAATGRANANPKSKAGGKAAATTTTTTTSP